MSIKERLEEYCSYKRTKIGSLCRHAGISQSYFHQVKSDIGRDIQARISNTYPDLNVEWLRTGEGEMLNNFAGAIMSPYPLSNTDGMTSSPQQHIAEPDGGESIEEEIRERLKEEIREEVIEEIKQEESIAVIPVEISNQVDIDIKKYIEENESELKKLAPSDLTGDVDGLEEVSKNSMWPMLVPGDRIFIKFLKYKTHITDGGFYYFNLKDRPTMIRQVKIDGNKLRLIALNPQFSDIVTTFDNVLRVADVKGMYRSFICNQYSEVEAVRRKKEEQIDKLLDQNQEALRIIGGLVRKK